LIVGMLFSIPVANMKLAMSHSPVLHFNGPVTPAARAAHR